jgi:hypothetical protein
VASSDSLPDLREVFLLCEAQAQKKVAERRATLDRKREAAQKTAIESQQRAITLPNEDIMELLGEVVEKHGECPICLWRITDTPYT